MTRCTDAEAAASLASNSHKSIPADTHPGMEGPRTGLPHLTPVSLRYQTSHAVAGNMVEIPYVEE